MEVTKTSQGVELPIKWRSKFANMSKSVDLGSKTPSGQGREKFYMLIDVSQKFRSGETIPRGPTSGKMEVKITENVEMGRYGFHNSLWPTSAALKLGKRIVHILFNVPQKNWSRETTPRGRTSGKMEVKISEHIDIGRF